MASQKVVMVISQFYPLLGGAEVQAQRLASSLVKRGVELCVLTRRLKGLPAFEVIDGIPVYRSIRTVELPLLWGLCYTLSVALFLYRKRREYTVIHCHILQEYQTVIAIFFKLLFNKIVIAKMSSSGLTSDLSLMQVTAAGKVTLRMLRKADRVISLCRQATAELMKCGFPPTMVDEIPNGVDISLFRRPEVPRDMGKKTITFIGRFDRFKGVDCLMEAFSQVAERYAAVHLKLVGGGVLEEELKQRAEKLGIDNKVIFRGWQKDAAAELWTTDIFVLPSLSEGMSNVLLEAMACGLPVVATSVGAAGDVLRSGINGIVVPPRNILALRDALLQLLGDDLLSHKMGCEARRTVEEHFALARVTDRYLKLYEILSLQGSHT